jgi:hypothetical protein
MRHLAAVGVLTRAWSTFASLRASSRARLLGFKPSVFGSRLRDYVVGNGRTDRSDLSAPMHNTFIILRVGCRQCRIHHDRITLCVTRSLRHHLSHDMTAEAPAYTLSEDQSPFEREGSGG